MREKQQATAKRGMGTTEFDEFEGLEMKEIETRSGGRGLYCMRLSMP